MPQTPRKKLTPERLAKLKEAAIKGGLAKRGKMSLRKVNESKKKTLITQRLYLVADKLINAQIIAATGTHQMIVMEMDDELGTMQPRKITREDEMQNLLDTGIYGEDYLILAGKNPDWKAAEALLNRGLGKAAETKTITVDHQHSFAQLAKARAKLPQIKLLADKEPIDATYTEVKTP